MEQFNKNKCGLHFIILIIKLQSCLDKALSKYSINIKSSINEALNKYRSEKSRLLVVIDDEINLAGVITNGDIVNWILNENNDKMHLLRLF